MRGIGQYRQRIGRITPTRKQGKSIGSINALAGVFTPVVTPFSSELAPDPRRYLRHCKWLPMMAALKATIAHFARYPGWATVRPPLVELTPEENGALVAELCSRGFDMPGAAS